MHEFISAKVLKDQETAAGQACGEFTGLGYSGQKDSPTSKAKLFNSCTELPQPLQPSIAIRFDVRTYGNMSLKVYDVPGREVAVLANEYMRAGNYERLSDAGNLSSGVYFYTLKAGEFEKTLRMAVVR